MRSIKFVAQFLAMNKLGYLIFFLTLSYIVKAAEVDFVASAPNTVVVGNQFRLTYSVNSSNDVKNFRAASISGFRYLAGPSQSTSRQVSVVNGKMTSNNTIKYTYVLMAEKEGTFEIPAATVEVDGKVYKSNTVSVKVLAAGKAASTSEGSDAGSTGSISGKDLFLRTIVNKARVHQQEYLIATIKLYTRLDVRGFENAKLPTYKGFLSYEIDLPQQLQYGIETVNGINYRTATLKQTILFPQRAGNIEIEQAELDCIIRLRNNNRSNDPFADFFNTYQDVRYMVKADKKTIKVDPFSAGTPSGFSYLSGEFSMRSSVDKTEVTANDPVTLKITISGKGNLKMIKTPEINFPGDFETYDAKVSNNIKNTQEGLVGSKTFEFLVIPRFAGEFTIPSYTFSYFDLGSKSYKSLTTPPYKINVAKGTQDENKGVVTTFANKENVKFLGKDIRFIHTKPTRLKVQGEFLFGSRAFWLSYLIPILLYFIILFLLRKQRKERANVVGQKRKKANPMARKKLKQAQQLLKKGDREAFYDETLRALWGYVADKLSINVAELNKENVQQMLLNRKVNEESIKALLQLLDKCEFARYAPSKESDELETVYKSSIDLISRLEREIK